MTLNVAITLLHLFFNLAFNVGDDFCVENMHILVNMRFKICIEGWLSFSSESLLRYKKGREFKADDD